MIRVVIYLIIVGLAALGAAWFADRPGEVTITWQQHRIDTSVMVLAVSIAVIAALAVLLWTMARAILRSPDILWMYLRRRRGLRGYLALSQGLIAVGSGDARAARKFADEAARVAPDEPLTLLLGAQAAQLAGDRQGAEKTFHAMATREDTRLLGLHGLYIEAQRRNDAPAARRYAEDAASAARPPAWAALAVFDARCAAGNWTGALERLDHNMRAGLIDREGYRRQRAVLLTARALECDAADDHEGARTLALEAVKLAPTLIPAAALAGRLLGEARELRRAARVVEAAWQTNPHPDLADAYAHLRPGDSARDRLARVQSLAERTPGRVEGALAVARAAIDAQEFAVARRVLAPLAIAPSRRVAMLMAELEEREHGDEGRAREWTTRAVRARHDPVWTADGIVADHWMPVSPATGRLDAFEWKDPISDLDSGERVIEHDRPPLAPVPGATAASKPMEAKPVDAVPAVVKAPSLVTPGADVRDVPPGLPPVIPLIHVPDDPGPEPQPDPAGEASGSKPPEGWRRLRGLFR
ncbi:MAG: heme biosynthesis protein HemY [Hyphomicrobiales bacterium]|nr:heme biosynthesis protein HemY [Hyphomicrobiales bacterium]